MANKQNMVSHPFNFDNDFLQSVDDVKASFSPRSWISVMELILLAELVLFVVVCFNLLVCHPVEFTSAKLVEHSHLFHIELVLVEKLSCINTPLEHACPYAEVTLLLSRDLPSILRIWRCRIAR